MGQFITAREVVEELRPLGSEAGRAAVNRFMKRPVEALGLTSPQLREVAKELYARVKGWPVAERDRLCTELFRCGYHEGGLLVTYLYRRFARSCRARELGLFGGWLERDAVSWAQVDGVGTWLVAAAVKNEPRLVREVVEWASSESLWKRRGAAVGLIGEGKAGRHWGEIREVALRLAGDEEDLVKKGVGWLLKEAYEARPREVVELLREGRFSRVTVRYAAEKMTAGDRQAVMGKLD